VEDKTSKKRRCNMPLIGGAFTMLANDRKLTQDDVIRAISYSVAAEDETTKVYKQRAESIDPKLAPHVLKSVVDEIRIHMGEFLKLLHELAPDEEKLYEHWAKEVEDNNQKKK
jgi:rubrerythrin